MCLKAQLVVPWEEKKNKRREVKERNIERKEGRKEKKKNVGEREEGEIKERQIG